jgi:lysophospholipase L1-like esterase
MKWMAKVAVLACVLVLAGSAGETAAQQRDVRSQADPTSYDDFDVWQRWIKDVSTRLARGPLAPERHKARVDKFLEEDARTQPPTEAVMFVGSTTIASWNLKEDFTEYKTINRGIQGALIQDTTYYADRLIVPYKPSTIVFYCGENDVFFGMRPEMVASHFSNFVASVHGSLPDTHIIFLSIRPNIARWHVAPATFETNKRIQAMTAKDPRLHFVDLTPALLGPDGKPMRRMLGDDFQHPSRDGFQTLTAMVKPVLAQAEAAYWKGRGTQRTARP